MSLLFAFVFFGCFCARWGSSSVYSEGDYGLHFPNKGITDYAIIQGMQSLTQFTVSFWVKTSDSPASPFSYGTSVANYANELLVFLQQNSGIELNINNVKRTTEVSAADGNWHHICTSWNNSDGSWQLYKDGQLENSGTGFQQGYTIKSGGALTLGQEQDSVGDSFDSTQSLQGDLANVNVWSHVLSADEIMKMSRSCLRGEGNVYKWSDFKSDVRGNTEVVIPSPCA